jgi:hypothetical protein
MPVAPLRQLQNMHMHSERAELMLQQTNPIAAAQLSMMGTSERWPYRPQAAPRPVITPLQHHSISIAVVPATADENMVPPHCGAAGRLPKFVSNLPLQLPPVGVFSVHDLNWCEVTVNKASSLAAAVRENRLQDFVQGEERRGRCTLNLWTLRAEGQAVLLNKRAECLYAAPKQGNQKQRKLLLPSEKAQPTEEGKEARLGSLQKGTSVKKDCAYRFTVKEYSRRLGHVIIKFPCGPQDTIQNCRSMQHNTAAGMPAHDGEESHKLQYTEEIKELVIDKLKAHVMPKVIKQGGLFEPVYHDRFTKTRVHAGPD